MFHNETICVVDSKPSNLEILEIGKWYGIGLASGISIIGFIGFVIRGLFIYFLKYEAPKDRPINNLIFNDQVSYILEVTYHIINVSMNQKLIIITMFFIDDSNLNNVYDLSNDYHTNCNSDSNEFHIWSKSMPIFLDNNSNLHLENGNIRHGNGSLSLSLLSISLQT